MWITEEYTWSSEEETWKTTETMEDTVSVTTWVTEEYQWIAEEYAWFPNSLSGEGGTELPVISASANTETTFIYALPIINRNFQVEYSIRPIVNGENEISYDLSTLVNNEIEIVSAIQVSNEFEIDYTLSYIVKTTTEAEYSLNLSINNEIEHESILAETVTLITVDEYDISTLNPINNTIKGVYSMMGDYSTFNTISLTAEI